MNQQLTEWIYLSKDQQRHEFFGEVQYRLDSSDSAHVKIIIKPDSSLGFELTCAALAIDGSKSMMPQFAAHLPPMLRKNKNAMQPILQELAGFLASNAQGKVAAAYWACGEDGSGIEPIGVLTADDLKDHAFGGPPNWGGGTKLTPVIKFFWEQVFSQSEGKGLALIITDGAWTEEDQADLLSYSDAICGQIASGERKFVKFVVVALRLEANVSEMPLIQSRFASLDDFEHPSGTDIWDHKWMDELTDVSDLFVEMVKGDSLGIGGRVTAGGVEVFATDDLKFDLDFKLPPGIREFTLHIPDAGDFHQVLG